MAVHPSFARIEHRPWPLPARPWVGRQSWRDLLFAHWPVPVELLRALVPEPLAIHAYEGQGYIAVVPFRMADVMLRGLPALPGISAFPELNVRTYVELDGKPGVWFFSLDATQPLAVRTARRFVHLPYHRAQIAITNDGSGFDYRCRREDGRARFAARYEPIGEPYEARPGTLEHFLTERYCLYARSPHGELYRTEVHHVPWPLQRARVEIRENDVAAASGIELSGEPPIVHFSARVDVATWAPERVRARA